MKKIFPARLTNKQVATTPFSNPKASQDSEDGAQISSGTDSAEPMMAHTTTSTSSAGGRDQAPNGHTDPKQRKIYLGLLAFSVGNAAAGLALILVWMYRHNPHYSGFSLTDQGGLSNLHPVLMFTFMVSLNMYAVLLYRTHYDRPKQQVKWAHAVLSGANILMSLLGVAAMYKAHLLGRMANFYSLHSWLGAMTNVFYLSQFLFGFVAFLKPGLTPQRRRQLMPWHRLAGAALLVLAAVSALTGITEMVIFHTLGTKLYQEFTAITFIANFAGVSIVLMTATSIYLLTARQYSRPDSDPATTLPAS